MPNPSLEPTRNDRAAWPFQGQATLPLWAAQPERWSPRCPRPAFASMISRQLLTASCLAFAWFGILLAGADHPPPVGFIWLLPVLLVFALLVYWRLPAYARLKQLAAPWRRLRVLTEGAFAGLVLAIVLHVTRLPGLQTVRPTGSDFAVWMLVISALGSANALLVYLLAPRSNSDSKHRNGA